MTTRATNSVYSVQDWCAAPLPLGSEGHAHENRLKIPWLQGLMHGARAGCFHTHRTANSRARARARAHTSPHRSLYRSMLEAKKGHAHENRSYIHPAGLASEKLDQLVQIVPTSVVRRDWSKFDVDRPVPCKCLPLLHLSTSASMKYV